MRGSFGAKTLIAPLVAQERLTIDQALIITTPATITLLANLSLRLVVFAHRLSPGHHCDYHSVARANSDRLDSNHHFNLLR